MEWLPVWVASALFHDCKTFGLKRTKAATARAITRSAIPVRSARRGREKVDGAEVELATLGPP